MPDFISIRWEKCHYPAFFVFPYAPQWAVHIYHSIRMPQKLRKGVVGRTCTRREVLPQFVVSFSVSVRVVNTWNNLPNSVDFTNLTTFVRTVKRVDLSGYLRCFSYNVLLCSRPIISIAAVVLLYSCLCTVTVLYVSVRAIVRALCAFLSCSAALFYCELLSITIWSK